RLPFAAAFKTRRNRPKAFGPARRISATLAGVAAVRIVEPMATGSAAPVDANEPLPVGIIWGIRGAVVGEPTINAPALLGGGVLHQSPPVGVSGVSSLRRLS